MKNKIILSVLITFLNFWIWRVFGEDTLLGVALIFLSISLIFRFRILTVVLFLVLSVVFLKTNPDTNLMYISPLEKHWLIQRHEYYAESLGSIYRNRAGLYLNYELLPYVFKYTRNLGYNLDPNLYFFANHPRERGGGIEFEKFSPFLLPLFIVGVLILVSGRDKFLISYFIAAQLVNALAFPGYMLGPILIFPFITATIYLGAIWIFRMET